MTNTIVRSLCAALFGLAAIPGAADAQSSAYTNSPAELYAGPAPDYPVVAELPPGTALDVFGCVSDYTWCDVALPGVRGWIDAQLLDYPYQGSYVPLLEYGAVIGVPVTGFAIGAYWDRYYRHRPWYHDRDRWAHRAEPRIGPGGMPPAQGRPQPGWPMQRPPGGVPPASAAPHDARPSATRGGWNGAIRTPAPQPAPVPMQPPMPGAAHGARPPAPAMPAAPVAPPAQAAVPRAQIGPGGAARAMPQAQPGGGGFGGRPQGGANNGGAHAGGGGGDARGEQFRH
ncbi:SH3 domain-containing protein [Burkholderia dolosa]|uniref:Peptide-binding protein n=6 Tax=Burkholderia dolosa TaxID=152500 RepID=A0A892IBC4_9BURK|nr:MULTISPECIES: SH3 domain-containing protein [Burkholderia]AKE05738.1 peptide-binding protein [Burkholderia cepacia]AJY09626.1 bacterial SH3 domain protein [Burkholderia dolosa AU0158]AYZ93931.1 peptide-binding protein [Burkholderia dolosa]ETP62328.1 peptide-binding protein [Burkholderia dolosa PC543]MBY4660007.1 SH3 domain-containing protein [Burkholderia dolosa]